jgi:hypothetical protein
VVRAGGEIELSWQPAAGAADHVVFADSDVAGSFGQEVGSSVTNTLRLPLPPGLGLWRVAGRSACGVLGPR